MICSSLPSSIGCSLSRLFVQELRGSLSNRSHPFRVSPKHKFTPKYIANSASVFFQRISNRKCRSWLIKDTTSRICCNQMKLENGLDDEACELVSGMEFSIGEGVDSVRAYLFRAVKNNNGTGILLLSDIFGFEDSSTRDFAYRVACNGYNVLVPDLFRGDPWPKGRSKAMFEEWLAKHNPERVARDISASTKWMVDEFVTAGISKKLGIIGFCYGGGRLIDVLAQDQGVYFGTGISFYGTRMNLTTASYVEVPVLFVSGDSDQLSPVSLLNDMERIIGRGSRVVIFEGRGHGFAHRPESPEEDKDAEKAFTIMRNWLSEGLAVSS
ncbi:Dienelactone hydrolase [Dillenia turbinata]|uniref:Carboxymethylenebutenolidase homolog n=1 Tax=Dillenia turbinata TaxID=194707 RepID=A0AAN8ZGM1_9MAGN